MALCWHTKGFGLAYHYALDQGYVLVYEYNAAVEESDLGRNYETEPNVSVDFTLYFSTSELDRYPELLKLLESKRHLAIESFYQKYQGWSENLRVYNRDRYSDQIINDYSYHPEVLFTEEELNYISQYTDVTVHDYENYEKWNGNDIPLNEYLSHRGDD
jgi:hypothetical protein